MEHIDAELAAIKIDDLDVCVADGDGGETNHKLYNDCHRSLYRTRDRHAAKQGLCVV